ncbi:MAG: structural protein P5 [Bacteroidaceae bacterium]
MTNIRGLRNKNPLNIRRTSTSWQGLRKTQTDPAFFQFTSLEYGYRAAFRTLHTYYTRYHLRTIAQMIARWAPPVENDTKKYIQVVARRAGISADAEVDIYNKQTMTAIVSAMSFMENGIEADPAAVAAGWSLAMA